MFRASSNVDIDVTTRSRRSGGLMAGVRRMLANDSFFLSTYRVNDQSDGEVGLAPTLQREIEVIDCDGAQANGCAPEAATLAPAPDLTSTPSFRASEECYRVSHYFSFPSRAEGNCW